MTFSYDAAGRRTQLTLPNGVLVASTYDAASRLTGLVYTHGTTLLGDLTYTYDHAGQRIATGGSFARTGLPAAVPTATYDTANQQHTLASTSLTFDTNGNLATRTDAAGTTTYTWNARNQLTTLSGPGLNARFQYDAWGRRQQKSVNGATTAFLYDGVTVVQKLAGGGATATLLTGLGVDEVFTRMDAAGSRAFLADALGSVLALVDSAGLAQTEYTYAPFGQTTSTGATSGNPFQYTSRENDGTGLYYYRARYYHPTLQRFLSEDPLGLAGGDVNLYGYVVNDPLNFYDPLGLEPLCKNPKKGKASYYNPTGRPTTSGARYDPQGMTAAMREPVPFGTQVQVTYKGNTIEVTVNDRGPFIEGRIIDLTPTAFRQLVGSLGPGIVNVEVCLPAK